MKTNGYTQPGVRTGRFAITTAICLTAGLGLMQCSKSPNQAGTTPASAAATAAESAVPADFSVRGRWPDPHDLTFAIDAADSPIGAEAFARAIARAAACWSATGVVGLRRAAAGETADVALSWRRGHHGACLPFGPEGDVAHSGPVASGTFVHFDRGREWSENGEHGVSVFHTALHELGHIVGLGHSEAESAVMGTSQQRPGALSPHDLAGLWSLYGGGTDGPGDLHIAAASGARLTLRRVAPNDRCAYGAFDCNGDGRDELFVWRNDSKGHGALVIYHISPQLQLEATRGPIFGVIGAGGTIGFTTGPAGERLIVCSFDGGSRVARQFDDHGNPAALQFAAEPELLAAARNRTVGDFDGDGKTDTIED
ncbi:MAG: matrixin family metalloprotease [Planctomycetes bacterium]|nr:matrixin family metalloprotease [Planctomycetota bacterium]